MDIRGWLLFVRDWIVVLLLGAILAGGAAFFVSSLLPRTYEAETQLLVGQSLTAPNPDYSQLLASQIIAQTYAEVAATRPTFARVIELLGIDLTSDELAQSVTVRAPANSTFLVITAQSDDASTASEIANAVADVLLEGLEDDPTLNEVTVDDLTELDTEIAALTGQITDLLADPNLTEAQQTRLAQLQDQREALRSERLTVIELLTSSSNRLTVVEPAVPPEEPISPRILLNTGIGAVVGLILTTLAVYIYDTVSGSSERRTARATSISSQARLR